MYRVERGEDGIWWVVSPAGRRISGSENHADAAHDARLWGQVGYVPSGKASIATHRRVNPLPGRQVV